MECLFYFIPGTAVGLVFDARRTIFLSKLFFILKISGKPIRGAISFRFDHLLFFFDNFFEPAAFDIFLYCGWVENIFKMHLPATTDGDENRAIVKEQFEEADPFVFDGQDIIQGGNITGYLTERVLSMSMIWSGVTWKMSLLQST